jgi:hypothetical protein
MLGLVLQLSARNHSQTTCAFLGAHSNLSMAGYRAENQLPLANASSKPKCIFKADLSLSTTYTTYG